VITRDAQYGHKAGREHRRLAKEAELYGMNKSQFNDYVNNPKFFRMEGTAENLSHRFEKAGSNLSWDRIVGHDALGDLGKAGALTGAAHAAGVLTRDPAQSNCP
jgi:hypothetical protein